MLSSLVTASSALAPGSADASPARDGIRTATAQERAHTRAAWTDDRIRAAYEHASSIGDATLLPAAAGLVHAVEGRMSAPNWMGIITGERDGQDLVCSASAVLSDSKLLVATAGHCLFDDGHYTTDVVFLPGYDGLHSPLGHFEAESYQVTEQWRRSGDLAHDAGFIKVDPQVNSQGRSIYLADVAGARPMDFGLARVGLHFSSFGYGAGTAFVRSPWHSCTGTGYAQRDGQILLFGCPAVPGMSGGPVYHYSANGPAGTQVGVISANVASRTASSTSFVAWGEVEYALYKTVEDFTARG